MKSCNILIMYKLHVPLSSRYYPFYLFTEMNKHHNVLGQLLFFSLNPLVKALIGVWNFSGNFRSSICGNMFVNMLSYVILHITDGL